MSRKTPKSTPNLLRQALTKTIINDETPNHSANNTAVGVEKAKTQFNLFKDTPRTVLCDKPVDDAQLAVTDDLFKAAKAATRARREKSGRLPEKRKDVLEDVVDEIENRNPSELQYSDEDISKSPGKLFRLKRKSRMITTRRLSQDGSLDEREDAQSNNSENDAAEENMEEARPPPIGLRRSIRPSHGRYLKESRLDEVEAAESSSIDNVSENVEVEMPQQQRGLRRSIRPVTRSSKVLEKVDGPLNTNVSEDHDTNVETPNFQAIRVQKPKLKTDFRKQLDHLQRASTPSTLIEDFRATGKAINVAELDITFDPNIESTRVGRHEFEDDEEEDFQNLETSPKRSSRRKSASRLSKSVPKILSEEDRGSYLNFEGDCEEESPKVVSNRLSQEMMPPPSSTVVKKTSRSHRLDSVLTEETLISDATVADLAKPSQAQKKKAKTTKREKSKEKTEILSDRELKKTFEKVSGLKVGPAVAPMLRQVHTELYEEAMETLEENTHGLPPKLGDWKDMFQQLGYLPKDDPDHSHLYALLRKYCTPEEMRLLVPRPTLHGGGKWTMDRNIWNQRAVDFDDDDEAFGTKKKKRGPKRGRKEQK